MTNKPQTEGYAGTPEMPGVADNGLHFSLTFLEEVGLSPYSVLEAAWVLPALIVGCRERIWTKEFNTTEAPHPILSLWHELHLLTYSVDTTAGKVRIVLTTAGENISKMAHLFEYEFSMMQQQLDENFVTDPTKYSKLRTALAMYSDMYLPHITDWIKQHVNSDARILDFGGGEGYYLEQVLKEYPDAHGLLYDKAPGDAVDHLDNADIFVADFRIDEEFFINRQEAYDTIIMSEVLHCMALEEWDTVMSQLASTLKPGGKLLVIEQRPGFRLDWRLKAMTAGGAVLDPPTIINGLGGNPELRLIPAETITVSTHYGVAFTKGEADESESH